MFSNENMMKYEARVRQRQEDVLAVKYADGCGSSSNSSVCTTKDDVMWNDYDDDDILAFETDSEDDLGLEDIICDDIIVTDTKINKCITPDPCVKKEVKVCIDEKLVKPIIDDTKLIADNSQPLTKDEISFLKFFIEKTGYRTNVRLDSCAPFNAASAKVLNKSFVKIYDGSNTVNFEGMCLSYDVLTCDVRSNFLTGMLMGPFNVQSKVDGIPVFPIIGDNGRSFLLSFRNITPLLVKASGIFNIHYEMLDGYYYGEFDHIINVSGDDYHVMSYEEASKTDGIMFDCGLVKFKSKVLPTVDLEVVKCEVKDKDGIDYGEVQVSDGIYEFPVIDKKVDVSSVIRKREDRIDANTRATVINNYKQCSHSRNLLKETSNKVGCCRKKTLSKNNFRKCVKQSIINNSYIDVKLLYYHFRSLHAYVDWKCVLRVLLRMGCYLNRGVFEFCALKDIRVLCPRARWKSSSGCMCYGHKRGVRDRKKSNLNRSTINNKKNRRRKTSYSSKKGNS